MLVMMNFRWIVEIFKLVCYCYSFVFSVFRICGVVWLFLVLVIYVFVVGWYRGGLGLFVVLICVFLSCVFGSCGCKFW